MIVTEYVRPPIPTARFDWAAWPAGEETPTGRGATENEALRDLAQQLFDLLCEARSRA